MDVKWIATDPDSQRLSFVERRTSADDYIARIEALLAVGEGYSEVQWADRSHPYVALAVRGGYGVVHLFSADGELFILAGDGVIDASATDLSRIEAMAARLSTPSTAPAGCTKVSQLGFQRPRRREPALSGRLHTYPAKIFLTARRPAQGDALNRPICLGEAGNSACLVS